MKLIGCLLLLFLMVCPALGQNKIIRDRFNNDVEVWKQSGSRTDVYDPYSNELLRSRYRDVAVTVAFPLTGSEPQTKFHGSPPPRL